MTIMILPMPLSIATTNEGNYIDIIIIIIIKIPKWCNFVSFDDGNYLTFEEFLQPKGYKYPCIQFL